MAGKESSMAQVTIMEAKTDLSELVRLLETHQEEVDRKSVV